VTFEGINIWRKFSENVCKCSNIRRFILQNLRKGKIIRRFVTDFPSWGVFSFMKEKDRIKKTFTFPSPSLLSTCGNIAVLGGLSKQFPFFKMNSVYPLQKFKLLSVVGCRWRPLYVWVCVVCCVSLVSLKGSHSVNWIVENYLSIRTRQGRVHPNG
jgi:hypothetical protein